jgi:transmembrane sensor
MEISMNPPNVKDTRIAEEAAAWVAELRELNPKRQAEFSAWLMESPRHLEQFFLMAELDTQIEEVSRTHEFAGTEAHSSSHENVVAMHAPAATPNSAAAAKRPRRWVALAAVCAGLAVLTGWLMHTYSGGHEYSTDVGEIRSFKLPDGSVVLLNTGSRVKVEFTNQERRFQLLEGEALFTAERDPTRPFRVFTGDAVIQALGTQFNVYRRPNATTVSVLDGSVGISSRESATARAAIELKAGRAADILPGGDVATPLPLQRAKVIAWQQRRLLFKEDTLTNIVAEFNRYNRTPKIKLVDSTVANLRLSGVFDADAPEALLLFLEKVNALAVERTGAEVRIRAAEAHQSR